ncbi:hypothetical protein H6G00_14075 [Leptolyngbya sp. FACHB-541]|uniref:hypothetical protein n=1 Tax=Leptolyngbya sp. FACHB-541 TaxID=2692810 RepID=UPI00168869CE|nr:hypothetical protein [Leptolyngbya sp. FACHB-541]MBD1997741.1 hypothetical protein [Leptolyngbya sp. FACHB-541]
MELTSKQIAEAFSSHKFELTYPYWSDHIRRNNVGGQQFDGRDNVIQSCEKSATHLATVKTKFSKFRTILSENCVVIDSLAEYGSTGNELSTVASCDIYHFAEGKVSEITSYNIELNQS